MSLDSPPITMADITLMFKYPYIAPYLAESHINSASSPNTAFRWYSVWTYVCMYVTLIVNTVHD